jgi:hypothetical protein
MIYQIFPDRSGTRLTLVSVGAPTAVSLTPIASRPCLVMRSAMGPASASRRQARSEPLARTSSSSPVRMSLSTALRTASPGTFVGRSTPRSLRCETNRVFSDSNIRCHKASWGIGESCHRDPPLRWCGVIAATTAAPPEREPHREDENRAIPPMRYFQPITLPMRARPRRRSCS